MAAASPIAADLRAIAAFCARWNVAELSLFGSLARGDAAPDSDANVLVQWSPGVRVGFLTLATMAEELGALLGRRVDLVPKDGLKPSIRDAVLSSARPLYVVPR